MSLLNSPAIVAATQQQQRVPLTFLAKTTSNGGEEADAKDEESG
jgi:hypothetical protein